MSTDPQPITAPAPASVTQSIVDDSRQKRRRIAASLWPRARLTGEILYHQVDRDRLFTQAAALTYKTLFSLLPIFVLSLLVLSTISAGGSGAGGKSALDSAVKQMLFDQLAINELKMTDDAGQILKDPDGHDVTLANFVEPLIEKAKSSVNGKLAGLVAFAVLLYGAISLMIVIEGTFNEIYGAVKPRSWPRRIILYWAVLTLGPIGVAVSTVFGHSASVTATAYAGKFAFLLSAANALTGFFITWLLVFLMYRLIPDTHVRWRPAALGALLAAIALETGKWGFGFYVQHSLKNNWYGPLALLPLFMFWIYLTWSVALIGLEISFVQQYWSLLKRRFFFTRAGSKTATVSDLQWVLHLGIVLYKNFKLGKTTQVHDAAESLLLPNEVTGELMLALETAGLVHCVSDGAYALARPAQSISAYDLLAAARALCQVPPELIKQSPNLAPTPPSPALKELESLEATWAKNTPLPALTGDTIAPSPT